MNQTTYHIWLICVVAIVFIVLAILLLFVLLKRRQNIYSAILLAGIAIDKVLASIGINLLPNNGALITLPDMFAELRIAGACVLGVSLLLYGLNRFGVINGVLSSVKDEGSRP